MSLLCPVCSSADTTLFDKRDDVPVLQNRLYKTAEEAKAARTGTLAMTGCNYCGFAWNDAFEADRIVYDGAYENDQASSPAFRQHLEKVAAFIVEGHDPVALLEVGCGQGDFMARLQQAAGDRFVGAIGFDPAWRGGQVPSDCKIMPHFFGPEEAENMPFMPTRVVSRHTIEHVPNPLTFTRALASAGKAGHAMSFFIETPCVDWIIKNKQVQDFFYEHCSLFTAPSLQMALEKAGLKVLSVEHVFGDQYLLAKAIMPEERIEPSEPEGDVPDFEAWQKTKQTFLNRWTEFLNQQTEPVYLWGAGAKGVTFALLMQEQNDGISGVIDLNPAKQGHFTAQTALPIFSPDALPQNASVIIMNPNYEAEIRQTLLNQSHKGSVTVLTTPTESQS
jgi:hypothetical protein